VAAEVTFVAGCAAGRLLAQALLGEREGVELLVGASPIGTTMSLTPNTSPIFVAATAVSLVSKQQLSAVLRPSSIEIARYRAASPGAGLGSARLPARSRRSR
jgi:hypothetical protein